MTRTSRDKLLRKQFETWLKILQHSVNTERVCHYINRRNTTGDAKQAEKAFEKVRGTYSEKFARAVFGKVQPLTHKLAKTLQGTTIAVLSPANWESRVEREIRDVLQASNGALRRLNRRWNVLKAVEVWSLGHPIEIKTKNECPNRPHHPQPKSYIPLHAALENQRVYMYTTSEKPFITLYNGVYYRYNYYPYQPVLVLL